MFFKHTNNDKGNQNIPKAIALIILGLSVNCIKIFYGPICEKSILCFSLLIYVRCFIMISFRQI